MEMKRMIVGFMLIAVFALPAFATTFDEKDVITPTAVKMILEKVSPNSPAANMNAVVAALTGGKTLVSNPVLEEELLKHSINTLGVSAHCGETCAITPRATAAIGCSCSKKICYKRSLDT